MVEIPQPLLLVASGTERRKRTEPIPATADTSRDFIVKVVLEAVVVPSSVHEVPLLVEYSTRTLLEFPLVPP